MGKERVTTEQARVGELREWLDEYEYAVAVAWSPESMARIGELERLIVAEVPALLARLAASEAVIEAARAMARLYYIHKMGGVVTGNTGDHEDRRAVVAALHEALAAFDQAAGRAGEGVANGDER